MVAFCEKVDHEGLLLRLLDKELGQDEQDAVLAHLRSCQLCLSRIADIVLTDAQMRQTFQDIIPNGRNLAKRTDPDSKPVSLIINPPKKTEVIPQREPTVIFEMGSKIQVSDLPVGSTFETEIYDSEGHLLVARNTPLTLQIIRGLQRRNITVVTIGTPKIEPKTALAHEAAIFKGRPDREFYMALEQSNISASISAAAKELAIDALKRAFHELSPESAIDLDDISGTCEDMINDLVEDEITSLTIIDMYLTDSSLYLHSINVAAMFATMCKALNLPPDKIKHHAAAALLHDLGRVLLRKITRGKTATQVNVDRLHAEAAYKYLQGLGGMESGPLNAVRNHHERYDGRGYPRGVYGRDLGDYSQVLILADYYDRVTWDAEREMKAGFHQAANLIIQLSRKLVDAHIVTAFLNVFGHHPPGSWVELSSGEVGMVVQATPFKPRHPKVHIFYDKDRVSVDEVIPLNLSDPGMPAIVGPFKQADDDDEPKIIPG